MTVALLGTGRMGSAMARAISAGASSSASAGTFELLLWNRSPQPAVALAAELGGRVVETPAEAARQASICLTMLADQRAVEAVYAGPDGLIAGTGRGSVLVDLSTVAPDSILGLETAVRASGAGLLDAPVSGSVTTATAGQLTLMVGGRASDLERARPVLDLLARKIFHLGPLGSGAAMKLAVNTVVVGLNGALAEGLVLAERAGIDRNAAYNVLVESAAGAPYVAYKRSAFVDPEASPTAFALELAEKDLRLIIELADRLDVALPQARTNLDTIRQAEASQGPQADLASVAGHLRAGVPTSGGRA
ncbi:MAG TPA: NAD(P)-dependent oxidoreductase [Candidatus Limnocylindrales bacterium]|jgi:3-hydroxyisobutyrate dehydrogenase-like beta-hydroxyacid dehydrogenase